MTRSGIDRFTLYGEHDASVPPEFVHLERIFDRSSLHDWTITPHAHPHMLQVLLVETGKVEVHGEVGRNILIGPTLVLVPPACVHAFQFDPTVEGWVLSLSADLINDPRIAGLMTGLAYLQQTQAVKLDAGTATFNKLAWLINDLAMRSSQESATCLAQVALILATALEALAREDIVPASRSHSALVGKFRALVEAHYRDHWAISDYAQTLGTTPSTLGRATRALTGQAPADFVHARLLLEAKRNLTFTGATVAQIGYALGFADPAYFARFFKSGTGQTASEFRKLKMRLEQPAEAHAER